VFQRSFLRVEEFVELVAPAAKPPPLPYRERLSVVSLQVREARTETGFAEVSERFRSFGAGHVSHIPRSCTARKA
jgi:hypothetical protein